MKVIKTTTTDQETSATLDIFEGKTLPKKIRDKVAEEVGQFIIEQTLIDMSAQKSPIEGEGKFPKLTSESYKKFKKKEVGNTKADIELTGETKDELDYKVTTQGLKIGVFGSRAGAADGHNNLSGNSQLPRRRFIPGEDDSYNSNIAKEVDRIIADAIASDVGINPDVLADINTSAGLYDVLGEALGLSTEAEIRLAVFRNEDLLDLLREEDLVDLL